MTTVKVRNNFRIATLSEGSKRKNDPSFKPKIAGGKPAAGNAVFWIKSIKAC
jgi:hypothetical protein